MELAAETVFRTSEIETADTLVTIPPSNLCDILSHIGRKLTHGAHDDVHSDREVITSKSKTFTNSLHNTTKAQTFIDVKNRTETNLKVSHTIVPTVLTNLVHNTSQSIRSLKNLKGYVKTTKIFHKRRTAISNAHKLPQFILVKSRQFHTLLLSKFNDSANTNTTIKMLVKLCLRELTHNIICNFSLASHGFSLYKTKQTNKQTKKYN